MKIKFAAFLSVFILYGFSVSQAHAQKTSAPEPPPVPNPKSKKVAIPKVIEYIFDLRIDANSEVSLAVQITEQESGNIGTLADTQTLTGFFALLNGADGKRSDPNAGKINKIFIVRADPSLNFGATVDFLQKLRKAGSSVKLEFSKTFYDRFVSIPNEPKNDPKTAFKPDPLTLVVQITADGQTALNNEYKSAAGDFTVLQKTLTEVFRERADNGVFRWGTNEVEQTVFVRAARSLRLEEVFKVIAALKETGANPVVLQIDDLQ